ncbi:hypothetical protein QJS04_geneDACA019010 [Acorus gramineus]|uniref:Alanyl-tRNA synthetase class IIc N-terminal domain-containing protein n=1 Tax=Acorus gramineus TaxID=55184 RepID=A0AAV9BBZ3_ACOGR|nr:hypothetical protein QJS04_geneDACA019010 [Acorus gramineus]
MGALKPLALFSAPTKPSIPPLLRHHSLASAQPVTEKMVEEGALGEAAMSGEEIRRRFLDFYASRGHKVLPSASLVPDDPTVLLTIAGMLQFKPIFLGKVR